MITKIINIRFYDRDEKKIDEALRQLAKRLQEFDIYDWEILFGQGEVINKK